MNGKNESLHTYANPLSLPDIPRGKDDWYPFERAMFSHENKPASVTGRDYRSISDPTVFYCEGKWYLYPSYGMAWVTEDFERWEHVRTQPYCPKYSPCITRWRDKFLLTAWDCPLYVSDSPLGPFTELGEFILPDGRAYKPCDPCIFTDDDGRIYLYAFESEKYADKKGFRCLIVGYELDADDPRRILRGPVRIVEMDPRKKPWERHGLHNQDDSFGWVEGPHLLKYGGRYYMIYAAPDTCDASYCMAVYYSDETPLSGFVCQKRNPLTAHRGGIVSGAGHGCVERGPNGTLWAFYTIAAPYAHRYERRIGMDLVAVDENGELYCPFGVTDTPQYVPGYREDPVGQGNSPGYFHLTEGVRPVVSSAAPGRDGVYATDGNNLSFWLPEEDDLRPCIECDLSATFLVGAARLFWRETGLNYEKGVVPAPVGFLLEGFRDGEWFPLIDCTDTREERNIDYRSFEEKECEKVRLTLTRQGKGLRIGVIDFAVFGKKSV